MRHPTLPLSLSDEDGDNTMVYGPKLRVLYWVETATVNMEGFNVYDHGEDTCIAPVTAATVTKTTKATRVFRCGEGGKRTTTHQTVQAQSPLRAARRIELEIFSEEKALLARRSHSSPYFRSKTHPRILLRTQVATRVYASRGIQVV